MYKEISDKNNLFQLFLDVKSKNRLEIIDSHVHPMDVLGAQKTNKVSNLKEPIRESMLKPSLLEYLEYNNLSLSILKIIFYIFLLIGVKP